MKRLVFIVASFTVFALASPASASTTGDIVYSDAWGLSGIHAIRPDGTGHSRLVSDTAFGPRWSPDGSGFAFTTFARGVRSRRVEWADADGSNRHTLVSPRELPERWEVDAISWSPDGSQLLLSLSRRKFEFRVYVFPKNGSSYTLIGRGLSSADWGSNNKIVARRGGYLVTMNANGTHMEQIDGTEGGYTPRWSPDASHIVFQRNYEIWVTHADGQNGKRLTHTEALDWSPTWSPTGARIMWSRLGDWDAWGELWLMQADGGKQRRITFTSDRDEFEPDWR